MLLSVSPLKEKGWWLSKFLGKKWIDLYNDTLQANGTILEDMDIKCSNCLPVNVYVKYNVCA